MVGQKPTPLDEVSSPSEPARSPDPAAAFDAVLVAIDYAVKLAAVVAAVVFIAVVFAAGATDSMGMIL